MRQHQTPLRYPGGKQRLAPFVLELLQKNNLVGGDYVEPYAGGAGVAFELLLNNHVSCVHLNDSSYPIYAFWKCVINHPEQLCRLVSTASMTVDEWRKQREIMRNAKKHDLLEVGFSTLYLNRCNRSGVISGGLIGGLDQSGEWKMDARFTKHEIIRRIEAIAIKKDAIKLRNWNAERFIIEYIPRLPEKTFVYCDPPYFEKSSRLYLDRYSRDDHKRIAEVIQTRLIRPWIVSYDAAEEIIAYYKERTMFRYDLQYSASRAYIGREVFVLSDEITLPNTSIMPTIKIAMRQMQELQLALL